MLEKIGLPAKPSMRGANWVVDASHCQGCASPFSFINRKHHCRRCGGIFCGNCTSQRMVLRGQGDSPVRICDPCKKLEEAARYELRHGRTIKPHKGNIKAGPSEEDDLLAPLLGAQKPSQMTASLLGTSSSSSSSKDPSLNEENIIIRSLSADISQSVSADVTPDQLRQKAIEEKKMHRLLKSQGKPDQALQAFKRGRELERQADALEAMLRKNRKTAAGKVKTAESLTKKKDNKKDDLASELRDLGWTEDDIQADAIPKTLTVEGELSQILGEVAKKPSSEGKKRGVDNSQVIAMKKHALLLKKDGKLSEAKEELKKAKILEKELEERAILGESDDSEDELVELIRGLDGHDKTNDGFDLKLNLNAPIELPPMGLDIEKLLSGDLEQLGDFEVTSEDLHDPDLNSVLKSFGWDEEVEVRNLDGADSLVMPDKDHLSEKSVKDQVYTLKKEAVVQKKAGNLSEAMTLLKKAKLLEKDLQEVGFKESSPEIKERNSQPNTGANISTLGGRPGLRNKLAIQRELLAVKKQALALRREGKIEESDRELERGKLLEKELEEADNRLKSPANMKPITENRNPLEMGDETEEAEVTESDMQDPGLLSVLQNFGWDENADSVTAASDNFVKQPPRKNKLEIQRELLALKKRALALRREGKVEESQRELESAKLLEKELDDLNTSAVESKGPRQPEIPIPYENSMKLLEEPEETEVTETDMRDPALMSDLRNLGWDEDSGADVASPPILQEKTLQQEIGNFPNKPASAVQSGFGDSEARTEAKVTETDKQDPEASASLKTMGLNVSEDAGGEPYNSVPHRKVRKSKGEIQRELLVLKRKALQLRRQGREEEAESELEKAKELENQLAELESHCVPASGQLLMPQPAMESASSATRVTEKPIQVTKAEAPLLDTHLAEKAIPVSQINEGLHLPDQNGPKDEILIHKRKAVALKREGKISEAKEEFRQAKLLERRLEASSQTTHVTATTEPGVAPESKPGVAPKSKPGVAPESKPVPTHKSIPTRDRVKIQQESLSHKRNALKLRREGRVAEAEAEFDIAKSLEAQLDDSTGEDVSSTSDVAVEDFLDPQLMSALRSIGWGESDLGTVKQEPQKQVVEERETRASVHRDDERLKMEGEIKREKIKAFDLKKAGKGKEALEVLRNAKLMEKKLASIN